MGPMAAFYAQTWWLWMLLLIGFIVMAVKVHFIFWLFVPGVIVYSFYFAWVRVTDESRRTP